jgi:multidrug efflux pump subunit AcrA (membrane-fusion protein)
MRFASVILTGVCMVALPPSLWAAETAVLPDCHIVLDDEAQVPAQEAGVLLKILVRDGQPVVKGELLAQIDDMVPTMQQRVAEYKLRVAETQANDDVDKRYAEKAAAVAEATYNKDLEANRQHSKTVTEVQLDEHRLEWEKFKLAIEKAKKDQAVAKDQVQVSAAELKATEENVHRRKIIAPLDAVVSELTRHVGEWVQQGETVMRLVRIDLLRVEGRLNAKDYRPSEILGRPVSIEVEFAHGKTETFPGEVVFVSPVIEVGNDFLVRAEVKNRKENGFWVLTAGLQAKMTIKLK